MTGWNRRLALAIIALTLLVPDYLAGHQESEAQLERQSRVGDLLKLLDARPGAFIADVGAGDGFYTVRIAAAVAPLGRATAVDISAPGLDKLRDRVARERVENVDVVLGAPDDPHLPAQRFDAVLIHNAYHEMEAHASMLVHIREALKPGGRLVVVEPMHDTSRGLPREKQVAQHNIAAEIVDQELRDAGFEVEQRDEAFIKFTGVAGGFWLMVARRR